MTSNPPKIENAPGLTWRKRKTGWEARWRPRTDLVARGYPGTPQRLWRGWELSDLDRAWISDRCNVLQGEMLVWARGGIPVMSGFDGTWRSLIACYQSDADSTYRKLRYRTRMSYDSMLRRIEANHGGDHLAETKARTLLRWHEDWSEGGKIAGAHSLVGMVRTLIGFGATILEDPECERLSGILHRMKFTMTKPRQEHVTAAQANAIRAMAHKMGRPSIALAQAFQFECTLRQKDVIGEWVPLGEPGASDVLDGQLKWLRGLRWSEIDRNLILQHTTSKRLKDIEVDLKLAPMVVEELGKLPELPASGPIVVCEFSGQPWTSYEFRRWWRKVADACGIPKTVYNMDSRAGAITEGLTATGGDLDSVRIAATHSNVTTTQGYSRGNAERTANVMRQRVAHRNKG